MTREGTGPADSSSERGRDVVVIPPDVVFREVQGEAVLLSLSTGQYFGLNRVGTAMWRALAETGTVSSARASLLGTLDVEAGQLQADLDELIRTLVRNQLLRIEERSDEADRRVPPAAG